MCDNERGCGVQVVSVGEDGSYRCDSAALRRAAGLEAARGLPVAVVSVAGATRGGKSFLLDFFLRYLRAPEAARTSGAWLGADDTPLTGFSWRGGSDRDTKGILLWSEPIVLKLGPEENSKKVAVVLMDTQGTFDSCSTVRDSSTIFAMSTLISSVQIYNLSQNIKEDDLQYLQLFTEYGKLACDQPTGAPFEVLQILVRDWSYAYEHPVGALGGQQLLDKRLEIHSEQAAELKEIREHVRSVFEEVRCFLLPHPGLIVATCPQFKGCVSDISTEFKTALLELVSSLFSPENITLKKVNGQAITVEDLPEYFRTYTDIFNSEALPTPTTVMQATSIANLEAALNASRALYRAHLNEAAWVPRGWAPQAHAAAADAARAAFAARRTLAAPTVAAARLDSLMQELEALLPNYIAINNGKILLAIADCKTSYELAMCEEKCLSAGELRDQHGKAAEAALAQLDASRGGPADFEDYEDRESLEKELDSLLPLFHEKNEQRIQCAVQEARATYGSRMRGAGGVEAAPCLHPRSLGRLHKSACRAALAAFKGAWTAAGVVAAAVHEEALLGYFGEQHQEFEAANRANNRRCIDEAVEFYDIKMSEVFNYQSACLHPRALEEMSTQHCNEAKAKFLEKRDPGGLTLDHDIYIKELIKDLFCRSLHYETENECRNKAAVKTAHERYLFNIAPVRLNAQGLLEIFGVLDFGLFDRHEPSMRDAFDKFRSFRRGLQYDEDIHLDALKKEINDSYFWLKMKFAASIGAASLNIALVPVMLFLGKKL